MGTSSFRKPHALLVRFPKRSRCRRRRDSWVGADTLDYARRVSGPSQFCVAGNNNEARRGQILQKVHDEHSLLILSGQGQLTPHSYSLRARLACIQAQITINATRQAIVVIILVNTMGDKALLFGARRIAYLTLNVLETIRNHQWPRAATHAELIRIIIRGDR